MLVILCFNVHLRLAKVLYDGKAMELWILSHTVRKQALNNISEIWLGVDRKRLVSIRSFPCEFEVTVVVTSKTTMQVRLYIYRPLDVIMFLL
jgi:hypothetical protein